MAGKERKRSRSHETPVVAFRTHQQALELLDLLAQLEGTSRNRLINKALMVYAEDLLSAKGRTHAVALRNRLRTINILQRRIEVNLSLNERRVTKDLQEDRLEMLEEAYRYARYTGSQAALLLLSKVAGWIAETFQEPTPADMKERAEALRASVDSLIEVHPAETG